MTQHTPGPWTFERTGLGHQFAVRDGGGRTTIATTPAGPDAPHAANAQLIAATPDMLAALRGMLAAYFDALPNPACYDSTADNDPRVIAARAILAQVDGKDTP